MYNLFVSASNDSWDGEPWQVEIGRCVREYTNTAITKKFGDLDTASVAELKRFPCIFAYEKANCLAPKFGVIRDIAKRQVRGEQVRIEYEIRHLDSFLSAEDLLSLSFELDIQKYELNRSHWAVKDVDLPKELHSKGLILPHWTRGISKAVDISTHSFDVALSFPGEARVYVEQVVPELERLLGPNSYFYDNNYTSQLARPSLDTFLQKIYRDQSKLVVVFIGADYEKKNWCGVEFRAVRDLIAEREHSRIMFIRVDDGKVEGVFPTDGYVDARRYGPAEIAGFIYERVCLLT